MLESVPRLAAGDGPGRLGRPIIRRKLEIPARAADVVVRARLSERLRQLLGRHPVVTVFATAGAGKTTAVALAVRDLDRPVAWLSLDGTEQAAGRLLVYLEAAVEGAVAAAAGVATDALRGGLPVGEAAGLLAESVHGSRLIVVCDNVERVAADGDCHAALSSFARYLPPDANLVLISRVDIALDLVSTSERGRLGELPEADLAFDVEEAGRALVAALEREDAETIAAGRRRHADALIALATGAEPPPFPEPRGGTAPAGPLDGMLIRLAYLRGRLDGLDDPGSPDPWPAMLGGPWVIAALRATGRLDAAMAMYERRREWPQPVWLHAVDAVDLMLDLGREDEAWLALERGRGLIASTGSKVLANVSLLTEAKLWLRLRRDTRRADRVLAEAAANGARDYAVTRDTWQLWSGLSLLLQGEPAEAHAHLAQCLASMEAGDRRLHLAAAAVYLAEAQWRLGLEDESDASADLAMTLATAHGSHHLLLTALADAPSVAARAADATPGRTSRWHETLAALSDQRPVRVTAGAPRLILEEFGEPALAVDGTVVQPRLTKSVELLSYLLGAPGRKATRETLLGALFGGRDDAAGRSYLRQALYRLREVLPPELAPGQEGNVFHVTGPELAVGSGQRVIDLVVQAGRQDGEARLQTLSQALGQVGRGVYLAPFSGEWIDERRAALGEILLSARVDAARLAYRMNRYREAKELIDAVLLADPYREQAWQLAIALAHASGCDDAVLALYKRYVARMRDLGVAPSDELRRFVAELRR